MIKGAFASLLFGAATLSQCLPSHAGNAPWDTGTQLAQAPDSNEPGAQPASPPAPVQPQPAPAAPALGTPPAGEQPPAAAPNAPTTGTAPAPIQLPPVQIIQSPAPAPKRAKPKQAARKAVAPRRRAPALAPAPAATVSAPAEVAPAEQAPEALEQGVAMSPVKGSEIPLDKVPGAVSQVTSTEIERSGSPAIEDALQQNVPGVIISDVNGNPFATDIQYRGFTASPVEGTPQGLAIYQNGVRINEVFGDTVNWDLIPSNAINGITVVSGNPLYGLNALGAALNIAMKDGFGFHGVESDTRGGSYGRFQESLQLGKQVDNFAAYAAVEGIWDSGWRQFSPSDVKRTYADLGAKTKDGEFHINFTGAENSIGAVGPTPVQLLAEDYSAVFTNPQITTNQLAMLSANGNAKLTDTWSLSGVTYLRSYHQHRTDGNVSSVAPCNQLDAIAANLPTPPYDANSPLCLQTAAGTNAPVKDQFGNTIPTGKLYGPNATIGELDYTSNNTNSFGGSLQATAKDKIFDRNNIFIAGASADIGAVKATSVAELGTIDPQSLTVIGNGVFLSNPLDIAPLDLKISTNYYGVYFSDTVDVTKALSATVGGRYNYEEIQLNDLTGGSLTGGHVYTRFNPMAGLTYKFNANISSYGSYAEANRAPTPAELACADPAQPCLLQNFLVSDPNLKQVVSKTWQGGFRGSFSPFGYGQLNWSAGVYHTENLNDIQNVTSPLIPTRGYFQNAGNTLRQGVEASANYSMDRLSLHANYAYVDATFLNFLKLPSPNNPFADADGNIFVRPGDRIPTIPLNRLKVGFDYSLTDAWKIGADAVLASGQYYFGDQSNQNPQVPGYGVVNLRTSYEVMTGVTVYGLINNLFDHKYATYGTFYDTNIVDVSGNPSTALTDPRMITPAQPFSIYGGVKVRF